MPDIVIGSLLFIPGLFKILFFGVFAWLLFREFYKRWLINEFESFSRVIDIGVLAIITYGAHVLYLFMEPSL
ncbi:hypothetical protein HZF02_07485 [Pseudomonas yamanorum]|nr:hypothetical protein HZF02_07485 [Pseudomonas yamanorum]